MISKRDMVLTRHLATYVTPISGKLYPPNGKEEITVLLYDSQFLNETGNAWPIEYSQHADWILRLAEDESTRPKSIFLDITFTQKRNDSTVSELLSGLCKAKKLYGVDIYLAGLPRISDGQLFVREELMPGVHMGCFRLAGVNYKTDAIDRLAWDYPLYSHQSANGWTMGRGKAGQPDAQSAALAIASSSAQLEFQRDDDSIAIVWGTKGKQPKENRANFLSSCRDGSKLSAVDFVPDTMYRILKKPEPPPICPYNQTYSISQLLTLPQSDMTAAFLGKHVIIGAAVPGQNDLVDSPVHGLIPGAFLHAMALDNLLTFGNNFKRSVDWNNPTPELFWIAVLAIFIVLTTKVSFNCLFTWLKKWPSKASGGNRSLNVFRHRVSYALKILDKIINITNEKNLNKHSLIKKFAYLVLKVFGWLGRISIQIVAATFAIVAFQKYFSIGVLPLIELIALTIFAEMFDYMGKLRSWLSSTKAPNN